MSEEVMRLNLALIGDNISRSRSPLLHKLAGERCSVPVTYERLIPKDLGRSFHEIFSDCLSGGYRGINVTYPYKEQVVPRLRIDEPLVRAMGAVNTVIFEEDGPRGYNTDHSGFMAAYRRVRGDRAPGSVLMIGTGGVGRAVAFGLLGLGATEIRLVDRDPAKSQALAEALRTQSAETLVRECGSVEEAAEGADGLINCTPVGMVGYEGTPLPEALMGGAEWAFDAVYTPPDTQFMKDAEAHGLQTISGWELFFYQGVHAWQLFSGRDIDEDWLRTSLHERSD
jgi:shikimate dehydrogenase